MKVEDFISSIEGPGPPDGSSPYLTALWHEKRGDWTTAHEIVQAIDDRTAAWVHAYLHRREGDQSNAAYWYGQADRSLPAASLDEEWEQIVEALL
ncbi:MAG: hypothetical protein ABI882_23605 [Acidobacteriota bacterium]